MPTRSSRCSGVCPTEDGRIIDPDLGKRNDVAGECTRFCGRTCRRTRQCHTSIGRHRQCDTASSGEMVPRQVRQQHLDRVAGLQIDVLDEVDRARTALAQGLEHHVPGDVRTDQQRASTVGHTPRPARASLDRAGTSSGRWRQTRRRALSVRGRRPVEVRSVGHHGDGAPICCVVQSSRSRGADRRVRAPGRRASIGAGGAICALCSRWQ